MKSLNKPSQHSEYSTLDWYLISNMAAALKLCEWTVCMCMRLRLRASSVSGDLAGCGLKFWQHDQCLTGTTETVTLETHATSQPRGSLTNLPLIWMETVNGRWGRAKRQNIIATKPQNTNTWPPIHTHTHTRTSAPWVTCLKIAVQTFSLMPCFSVAYCL